MSYEDVFLERQKIWVIGCKGLLGTQIIRQMEAHNLENIYVSDIDIDITKPYTIDLFTEHHPDIQWIINCAAFTDIDRAETDLEKADALNNLAARNVARCAKKIGAHLIHFSTNYVFDGKQNFPYTEESQESPVTIYGKTKFAGDKAVLEENDKTYVIRTANLYGPYGPNFVYSLIDCMNKNKKIALLNDQFFCPTFTGDLSFAILSLICPSNYTGFPPKRPSYGVYNFTNTGKATWYEVGLEIYRLGLLNKLIQNECQIMSCSSKSHTPPVPRPTYSVLSTSKIQDVLNLTIPSWQESLDFFMKPEIYSLRVNAERQF